MFEFLKKRKTNLNIAKDIPGETKIMKHERIDITQDFEDILTKIDNIRIHKNMTPQEKYATMLGSLYMINKISDDLIKSDKFFADKQFKKIDEKIRNNLSQKIPNYIG